MTERYFDPCHITFYGVFFNVALLFTLKIWKCLTKFVILMTLGEFSS